MIKFLSMLSLAVVVAFISFTALSSDSTVSNLLIDDGFEESSLKTFVRTNSSENECDLIAPNRFSGAPQQKGNPVAHALDGNPKTRWAGKSRNAQIILNYAEAFVSCRAIFKWYRGGDGRVYPFEVYGSKDGKTFDLLLFKGQSKPNTNYQSFALEPKKVKAIKLVVKGNSNNAWSGLYEFAISKKRHDNPPEVPANKACTLIGPSTFTASPEQKGHPVALAVDGDRNTRWAGKSRNAQVTLTYRETFETCQILFRWYKGGYKGRIYPFEVYGAKDGENFNTLLLKSKSSPNENYQYFNLRKAKVNAIKIVIRGNSVNEWAGLYEVALKKGTGKPVVDNPNAWRSSLYPENWSPKRIENKLFERDAFIQDFSQAGYRYGAKPPNPSLRVFDVTNYGADKWGNRDSTVAIQNAINAAENNRGGGIVYMPRGTYKVAPRGNNREALRISKNNIILRGAGVGKTFLVNTRTNMREKSVIRVYPRGDSGAYQNPSIYDDRRRSISFAKDVLSPTRRISLTSVDGLHVGQWVVLRNTPNDSWANEHKEPSWRGRDARYRLRGQAYIRKIEKIDHRRNVIEVDIPVRYYLKKRDNARLQKLSGLFLKEVGIEGFSIGMAEQNANSGYGEYDHKRYGTAAYNSHKATAISIGKTLDSWVKGVSSFKPSRNRRGVHILSYGLAISQSARISVIDTVMKNVQYGGAAGNGYAFSVIDTQDSLFLRTQSHFSRHGFVLGRMATTGNVFHKCVDVDSGKAKGNGAGYKTHGRSSDTHAYFSHSNLFDSCTAIRSTFEARYRPYGGNISHGVTSAHGVYWNTTGKTRGMYDFLVWSQQGRFGYVIGTQGDNNGVKLDGSNGYRTEPQDILQGQGRGADLKPQSLWLDQRKKRSKGFKP